MHINNSAMSNTIGYYNPATSEKYMEIKSKFENYAEELLSK